VRSTVAARPRTGQACGPVQQRLTAQAACDGAGLAEGHVSGFGVEQAEVLGVVEQPVREVVGGTQLAPTLAASGHAHRMQSCRQADRGGVTWVTDSHPGTLARWQQPVIPQTGNRKETAMHPSLQYDLMQSQQRDRSRATDQRRLAAQAGTARRPRRHGATAAPRRVQRLVWRLLPG